MFLVCAFGLLQLSAFNPVEGIFEKVQKLLNPLVSECGEQLLGGFVSVWASFPESLKDHFHTIPPQVILP